MMAFIVEHLKLQENFFIQSFTNSYKQLGRSCHGNCRAALNLVVKTLRDFLEILNRAIECPEYLEETNPGYWLDDH